ncbi:MAG: multiheme c-type cytochrome [Rubripirellula sp.]
MPESEEKRVPSAKYLVTGFLIVAVLGFVFWNQVDQESVDIGELKKRQQERQLQEENENSAQPNSDAVFAELAKLGKAAPIPHYLQVNRNKSGAWIVRQPGGKVAAVLPFPPDQSPKPPSDAEPIHENPGFLGAKACEECHAETFASFAKTSHHLTSHLATPQSIRGSLESGKNRLGTRLPNVSFKMVEHDGSAFQRASFMGWEFEIPMQIVTGSSKLAQTFLYWNDDELYQCNITYLTETDSWINSPGYRDGDAAYERPILARCLECHMTYADFREPTNRFTPRSLITGISCERCHGPGREHVEYHHANPEDKKSRFVTVPSDLPRDKELQVCSQCHSSITPLKGQPFSFRPGDDLIQHYEPPGEESGNSVHTSNQLDRLGRSKCFLQTEMTCVDCHNPHHFERGNIALFSQRCMKCHQPQACGMSGEVGDNISSNCIDCHMPFSGSDHLRLDTASESIFPEMRDHYIRIDKQASESFLKRDAIKDGNPH